MEKAYKKILTRITLATITIVFMASPLLAMVVPEEPPLFLRQWGSYGTGDGQFMHPWGIVIDSEDNVYVADNQNHRIQKFEPGNPNGRLSTVTASDGTVYGIVKWGTGGTGDGQFRYPAQIALDSEGNVYVADIMNHRVQKFTSDGVFITKLGSYGWVDGKLMYPYGVGVDSLGNVYVTDQRHRIQKFEPGNPNGRFSTVTASDGTIYGVVKWGGWGYGDGKFYEPWGVAVDSEDNIYVADKKNCRIQKFTSDGVFITKWGSSCSWRRLDLCGVGPGGVEKGDGKFQFPVGITVDSSGNVYVADTSNHRVQKFTSDGVFITKWGKPPGCGWGQFTFPYGIATDSAGNVYVTDTCAFGHRVQKFGSPCEPITGRPEVDEACCVKDGIYIDPLTAAAVKGTYEGDLAAEIDPTKATHGSYVSCVAHMVNKLRREGFISANEGGEIVRAAGQSDVNKPEGSIH